MENNERKYFLVNINSKFPLVNQEGKRCKLKYTSECYIEVLKNGDIFVYKIGTRILHNPKGIAVKIKSCRKWLLNGCLHRLNGPAIERSDGVKEYWVNDNLHRLNGPAWENPDHKNDEWFVEGKRLSKEKEKLLNIWYENNNVKH